MLRFVVASAGMEFKYCIKEPIWLTLAAILFSSGFADEALVGISIISPEVTLLDSIFGGVELLVSSSSSFEQLVNTRVAINPKINK